MLKINMYFTVIESLYQDLTTSKSRVNANICQQSFISDIIIRIFFAQFIYLSFVIDLFKAKQLTTIRWLLSIYERVETCCCCV